MLLSEVFLPDFNSKIELLIVQFLLKSMNKWLKYLINKSLKVMFYVIRKCDENVNIFYRFKASTQNYNVRNIY